MSVIMTLRARGDAGALERLAAEEPERMQTLIARAKEEGLIAHRFFEAMGSEIQPMMAAAGVTAEPEIVFWHAMNMGDDVGWGA